jgi:hypothetical protein
MSYSSLFGSWSILVLDCDIVGKMLMENATKNPYDFQNDMIFYNKLIEKD